MVYHWSCVLYDVFFIGIINSFSQFILFFWQSYSLSNSCRFVNCRHAANCIPAPFSFVLQFFYIKLPDIPEIPLNDKVVEENPSRSRWSCALILPVLFVLSCFFFLLYIPRLATSLDASWGT